MQITKLEYGKRNPNRVNVYLDSKFWMAVDLNILLQFRLEIGQELTLAQKLEITSAELISSLTQRGYKYWLVHPRSQLEIRQKLNEYLLKREKGFGQGKREMREAQIEERELHREVLEVVLQKLNALGVEDQKFAEWFVLERARQGKYGKRKVLMELMAKGVNSRVAENALAAYWPEAQQDELRQKLLHKKFGVTNLEEISDWDLRAKAYRYLQSKGL